MYKTRFDKEKYIMTLLVLFFLFWALLMIFLLLIDFINNMTLLSAPLFAMMPAFVITYYLDYFTDWTSSQYWIRGTLILKEEAYLRIKGGVGYFYYFTITDTEGESFYLMGSNAEYICMNEDNQFDILVRKKRILEVKLVSTD